MSITIEEAIERNEDLANLFDGRDGMDKWKEECEQYAAWFRELVERRKEPEIIRCGECEYREIRGVDGFCDHITGEPIMVKKTDYCSWAERKTDGNTD